MAMPMNDSADMLQPGGNPWEDITHDPLDPTRASALVGAKKAAAMGIMSPDEVKTRLKAIGVPDEHIEAALPDDEDEKPTNQSNVNGPMPGQEVGSNGPIDQDQREGIAQAQALMRKQMEGIQNQRNYLAMTAQARADQPLSMEVSLTPLAAYADSINAEHGVRSNLAGAAASQAPESPTQLSDKFFAQNQGLQKDQNEVQRSLYDNIRAQAQMALQNRLAQMSQARLEAMEEGLALRGRAQDRADAMFGLRVDNTAAGAAGKITGDAIGQQLQSRINQIGIDKNNLMQAMKSGEPLTKQRADELAQGVATALSGAKAAGFGMSQKQEYASLEGRLGALQQYISGEPTNYMTPQFQKYLYDTLDSLGSSYKRTLQNRLTQLKAGRNYSHTPAAKAAVDQAAASFGPTDDAQLTPPGQASASTNVPSSPPETRVRVKHPKGQIGSIPVSQLPDALKAGYVRVQ